MGIAHSVTGTNPNPTQTTAAMIGNLIDGNVATSTVAKTPRMKLAILGVSIIGFVCIYYSAHMLQSRTHEVIE